MQIKTYNPKTVTTQPHFYVLNKGLNSGKPLKEPCPNCFVVSVADTTEREFYFWVCYALWQGHKFLPLHKGTAVQFITIGDLKRVIREAVTNLKAKQGQYEKAVKVLVNIDKCFDDVTLQLVHLKELKTIISIQMLSAA